jgi:surface antigen
MNKIVISFFSFLLIFTLGGCAGMSKQDAGVLTGGAIGGAVGSLFGGGSGKIVAAIGGAIGKSMDDVDRMKMMQALDQSRTGHSIYWRNPDSGYEYSVRPTKTYYRGDQPCRDFTTTAIIGAKRETIYGHACRKADGTWKVVN